MLPARPTAMPASVTNVPKIRRRAPNPTLPPSVWARPAASMYLTTENGKAATARTRAAHPSGVGIGRLWSGISVMRKTGASRRMTGSASAATELRSVPAAVTKDMLIAAIAIITPASTMMRDA
jgi:hypothetical protein